MRNENPVLSKGKLSHIYPVDNIYVLVKSNEDQVAVILINSGEEDILLETSKIKMFLPDAKALINLKSKEEINLNSINNFTLNKMSAEIFLIRK